MTWMINDILIFYMAVVTYTRPKFRRHYHGYFLKDTVLINEHSAGNVHDTTWFALVAITYMIGQISTKARNLSVVMDQLAVL